MDSGVQKQQQETAEGIVGVHREKTSTNHETMSTEHLSQRVIATGELRTGTKPRNTQTHGCCCSTLLHQASHVSCGVGSSSSTVKNGMSKKKGKMKGPSHLLTRARAAESASMQGLVGGR